MRLHQFRDLENGTIFLVDGRYYIKSTNAFTFEQNDWNAVDILDGSRAWFNAEFSGFITSGIIVVRENDVIEL